MTDPTTPPEYIPFDMDCARCEHEPTCILPLKVINKLTRKWFLAMGRFTICRQGRKRRNVRQCTIGEILDRRQSKNAALTEA
jgi:hypothetical protein